MVHEMLMHECGKLEKVRPAHSVNLSIVATRRLISAGVDGAVYEWRVATMRRERENVLKVSATLAAYSLEFARPRCHCAVCETHVHLLQFHAKPQTRRLHHAAINPCRAQCSEQSVVLDKYVRLLAGLQLCMRHHHS